MSSSHAEFFLSSSAFGGGGGGFWLAYRRMFVMRSFHNKQMAWQTINGVTLKIGLHWISFRRQFCCFYRLYYVEPI